MTDQMEVLRLAARHPWELAEVVLLVSTLAEAELDRLGELLRTWPAEREWPPPRAEIRRCLDPVSGVRS